MSIPFALFDHDIIICVLFDCHSIIHIIIGETLSTDLFMFSMFYNKNNKINKLLNNNLLLLLY